jgi:hypothetical protein
MRIRIDWPSLAGLPEAWVDDSRAQHELIRWAGRLEVYGRCLEQHARVIVQREGKRVARLSITLYVRIGTLQVKDRLDQVVASAFPEYA